MKYKEVKNGNYCAIVVDIKTLVPMEGCDNIQHAVIMGNRVVVSKTVKIGDVGLYFPVETSLSKDFLKVNNLYKDKTLNSDTEKKGYFEENGRVRCMRLKGFKSEGLFMPIDSIAEFLEKGDVVNIGDVFDELNGTEICKKYVIKTKVQGTPGSKKGGKSPKKVSKLIEGQFKFHQDTSMLYRNIHRIKPDTLVSITYKLHGTSSISSKILCKKTLKWYEKILKRFGVNVVDTQYDNIYASRRVIKND
ncbi:hypothetical protein M0Q50_03695 [bacterium]|nr:hypothetical protein [bacterium]